MGKRSLRRYTADMVVLHRDGAEWSLLVCVRAKEPFLGQWVLPGGHVDPDETGRQAAIRELAEETGLRLLPGEDPVFVGVADEPGLDPRGPVVSCTFGVVLPAARPVSGGDDAAEALWVPVAQARSLGMGYDHLRRVQWALEALT